MIFKPTFFKRRFQAASKNHSSRIFRELLFLFALFSISVGMFSSCITLHEVYDFDLGDEFVYIPEEFIWGDVTDEIQYAMVNFPESPVIYHIAKIDLRSPKIQIVEYVADRPENKKKAIIIDKFYQRTNATIGFNTSPFKVSNRLALAFTWIPSKFENIGIHIADGVVFSPAVEQYCALAFFREEDGTYRAEIFDHQTEVFGANPGTALSDTANIADIDIIEEKDETAGKDGSFPMDAGSGAIPDFAFGGFYTILRDGEKRTFPANNYDSRTGAGLADDGKTLYVMIVEGEKQKTSLGLSYPACADVFAALGCDVAMQFDGGGSSGLFVNGKNVLTYKPICKNPSFMGVRVENSIFRE